MKIAAQPLAARVWAALREVEDPEMPINLVDLGLVYGIDVGERSVRVQLTFTAMGCPATQMIIDDIRSRILREPGIDDVQVDIVWDPPWSSSRLSEDGRQTLQAWGLAV